MKLLKKIGVFFGVILTLLTTTGFSVEFHFCRGEVESYGVFGAAPCLVNTELDLQPNSAPCHTKRKNPIKHKTGDFTKQLCCHNEIINVDTDFFSSEADFLKNDHSTPFALVPQAFFIPNQVADNLFFPRYKPPLLTADIGLLVQVFRI